MAFRGFPDSCRQNRPSSSTARTRAPPPHPSPHQDTFISHLRGRAMPSAAQKQGGGRRASGGPANATWTSTAHGSSVRVHEHSGGHHLRVHEHSGGHHLPPPLIICRSSSAELLLCERVHLQLRRTPAAHRRGGAAAAARRCSAAAEAAARRRDLRPTRWCSGAPREIDERENILHHPNVLRCPPRQQREAAPRTVLARAAAAAAAASGHHGSCKNVKSDTHAELTD